MAFAGKHLGIIDTWAYGGSAALRGRAPKEVLVGAVQLVDSARRTKPNGIQGEIDVDWLVPISFRHTFTNSVRAKLERSLGNAGVGTRQGRPHVAARNGLCLDGQAPSVERIAVAALAIRHGLTAKDVETGITVRPSETSDVAATV